MTHDARFFKGGRTGVSHSSTKLGTAYSGTVGDVDGDGCGDLIHSVTSAPSPKSSTPHPGSITIQYGSSAGPTNARAKKVIAGHRGRPRGQRGRRRVRRLPPSARRRERRRQGRGRRRRPAAWARRPEPVRSCCSEGRVKANGGMTARAPSPTADHRRSTRHRRSGDDFGRQVHLTYLDKDGHADLTATAPARTAPSPTRAPLWNLRGS